MDQSIAGQPQSMIGFYTTGGTVSSM